ncbi:2-hydroxymuconic semialdehyde dehydrogenase [Paenalcaligenes sp. Me131]|uniref:2-hydroxymuconic semialdehyde dehydrogenase n=1 Tax=Paenalcaligenes sp. Me131 TaxID=3392636 RepID=UPI003D26A408
MHAPVLPKSLKHCRCYVNGEFVKSTKTFANYSPVDGKQIAVVYEADEALVDYAVHSAKKALSGPWGAMTVEQRAVLLHKVADIIEARFDEFVAAEVMDTGRPVHQAKTLDVYRGIHNLRTFADLGKQAHGEMFESHLPDGTQLLNYTRRSPVGVVASISPWNLPLLSLTWKAAPALICGNTLLCKPSEETPSSATLLAEAFHEAGVPPGVFNVLHGFGKDSTGEFLTSHHEIDAVTFTGESGTGSTIMQAVAQGVKPVSFELGGKNAAIVFKEADFTAAVQGIVRSSFTNSGQVCLCTERVYVHRSIFKQFVAALKVATEALKVGKPNDPDVNMGPLISLVHKEKVLGYMRLAEEEGAVVVTGGGVPTFNDERDYGAYVQPTVWTGLPDTARCMQEEVFGPVCHISPFDDEDEVIQRANNTHYGLAAVLWTENLSQAHRVAAQMKVGVVWVNHWFARDLRTPFGGQKLSGLGREGGAYSLEFYSETTNVSVRI